MWLNKVFHDFIPGDQVFFSLLLQLSLILTETASSFNKVIQSRQDDELKELLHEIAELKNRCNVAHRQLFLETTTSIITPFNREDLLQCNQAIKSCTDYLNEAAGKIVSYKIAVTAPVATLTELILQRCNRINTEIKQISRLSKIREISFSGIRINKMKNVGSTVYRKAISELFETEDDSKLLIKQMELLNSIENALLKCEEAAGILGTVLINNQPGMPRL